MWVTEGGKQMKNLSIKPVLCRASAVVFLAAALSGSAAMVSLADNSAPDDGRITKIQATTVPNYYGYKVSTIDITYQEGTDLSGVRLEDYAVYDRGFNNPEFGKLKLNGIRVSGNTVTLTADLDTDKVTDRTRETYGTLCTSSNWYIDKKGGIHYGTEASTDALGITIQPNTLKKGLQWRKNMDLILTTNGEALSDGVAMTDGAGKMLDNTVWAETICSGLEDVELRMVDIGWQCNKYSLLGRKGEVPVYVMLPDNYDPNRETPYEVIDYQCGGGVCYWETTGGAETPANNLGCNVVYDTMMSKWHELYPDAIIMSVNVHSSPITNSAAEIAGALDYAVRNWNADKDRIAVVGNSQGTLICSDLIRQRPDLVAAFIECNGNFGAMTSADTIDGTLANSSLRKWTADEVNAVVNNGVALWMFNGETDGDNPAAQQDVINVMKDLYRQAGKNEEWIDLFVRASGLQSWKFKYWGETDHSVTKVVAWNYLDHPYTDVWENQRALRAGDTYTFTGKESTYKHYDKTMDYTYRVYPESVAEWLRKIFDAQK